MISNVRSGCRSLRYRRRLRFVAAPVGRRLWFVGSGLSLALADRDQGVEAFSVRKFRASLDPVHMGLIFKAGRSLGLTPRHYPKFNTKFCFPQTRGVCCRLYIRDVVVPTVPRVRSSGSKEHKTDVRHVRLDLVPTARLDPGCPSRSILQTL